MKIALIGYGKMGRLLEERLSEKGHTVTAIVDPYVNPGKELPSKAQAFVSLEEAIKDGLKGAEAAIEFTAPDAAAENLLLLSRAKIPLVCGTTGWFERLPEVSRTVEDGGISLVWAANYSLGVNIFYRIASYAAKLINPFKE